MGLEDAYCRARNIIGRERAECLEVAVEVERLRLDWQPEQVRVVMLAEFHVWTSSEEMRSRVRLDDIDTPFTRFLDRLGYGEPELVKPEVPNSDTIQYWKLFHDAVYGPDVLHEYLTRSGARNTQRRARNKLDLLEKVKTAGIWLVDASVTALYRKGRLVAGGDDRRVILACWESHVGGVLSACQPSAVLIVGKGVESAVGDAVRRDLGRGVEVVTVNQPNARMSRETNVLDRRARFDLCSRHRV